MKETINISFERWARSGPILNIINPHEEAFRATSNKLFAGPIKSATLTNFFTLFTKSQRERDSLRRRFAYGLHPPPPSSTSLSAALAHRSRLFLRLFAPRLRCFSSEEANAASAANPMTSDAAQILPLLQNLLINNDIQRERLTGLFQLYAPAAEDTNANVNTEDEQRGSWCEDRVLRVFLSSQTAREAALSSQVHFLEQRVQMLEEELENQKKLNAQRLYMMMVHEMVAARRTDQALDDDEQ
ncbi:hypothetical protein YC2023_096652 [Brassica napus]